MFCSHHDVLEFGVALLAEGVDRNGSVLVAKQIAVLSPSSRRAWIEMLLLHVLLWFWLVALLAEGVDRNNSIRKILAMLDKVALLAEGVDRNKAMGTYTAPLPGRPPRGGRG